MMDWFQKKRIDSIRQFIPREELLRRSRILVVDDERPDLIDDLQASHFAVDYLEDIHAGNLSDSIERRLYDLILLDFGKVGDRIGSEQGLSLLRHIKRVNPAIVVLSYTSKTLGSEHADFYRLADGVLPKDAGIATSMEKIEEGLRKAHSIDNLWRGVLNIAGVQPGSDIDLEWQDLAVRGIANPKKLAVLKEKLVQKLGPETAEKIAWALVEKVVEVGVKAAIGA